ncbi:MAG TPA: NADPH:quinone oxidoreductase family protein [Gammaproteobacteria bacterium]|nr:NADPH:quinone oxidoreductase family protein [Gammaproteobacteria bacterium]
MSIGAETQMRAWRCHAFGDFHAIGIERMPAPRPAPGELLIDVRAFAPGFPDMLMVQGLYQLKPPLPFTPCAEFSGVVSALGADVTGHRLGDAVMGVVRFGAAAERLVVRASDCLPLPATLDFVHGAAFLIAAKTAHVALVVRGGLQAGETLLVHGASGGVGLAAVELGKRLGATVIAAASGPQKLAAARARGADHLVDYGDGGFRQRVKALTGGRGADVIYDPIGGDVFDESLHCIAIFGRLLVIGFASGRIPQAPVNLALIKQITIVGVRAGEYGRQYPAGGAAVNAALADYARRGELRPHVHATRPFTGLVAAFDDLAGRKAIGRVVVTIDD